MRRFPPPWTVEQIPGGFKVLDANGQSLAYVYGRETKADVDTAKVLTMDEAPALRATSPSCQRYSARARASVAAKHKPRRRHIARNSFYIHAIFECCSLLRGVRKHVIYLRSERVKRLKI